VDPNQTLADIRAVVSRIHAEEGSEAENAADAGELASLVQALDEWLSNRGFLPAAWEEPGKLHRSSR
jgi:hypothetical protein